MVWPGIWKDFATFVTARIVAFGDAGAGVLAVTGGPISGIAGVGGALLLAGVALLALARRPAAAREGSERH
jgi:hypothetical protein